MLRPCRKCGVEFDGLRCKACSKASNAAYRLANKERLALLDAARGAVYRQIAKERIAERHVRYRTENAERIRTADRAYYEANKPAIAERRAAAYAANPGPHREAAAVWSLLNPQKKRVQRNNRRAREKASVGTLSAGLADRLYALQRGRCACCREALGDDYHLDHIQPLALGGSNEDSNIQLLRARCNSQKAAKHPVEFMQSRGFLL